MVESTNMKRKLNVADGIKDGIPISLGYFPIGMAYGILAKGAGLSFMEAIAFSFIVFAGASQFIAVSMLAMGASGVEIIITTMFVNFRHFLMSSSVASKIKFEHWVLKPIVAFFVTDETFSVASFADGELTPKYMLPMELIAYFGWGIGSGVGFLLGSILPEMMQRSMNIGLYAMFVALLVPAMKKTGKAIILAVVAAVVNSLLYCGLNMEQGWSIVLSIVIVAGIGALVMDDEPEGNRLDMEEGE